MKEVDYDSEEKIRSNIEKSFDAIDDGSTDLIDIRKNGNVVPFQKNKHCLEHSKTSMIWRHKC